MFFYGILDSTEPNRFLKKNTSSRTSMHVKNSILLTFVQKQSRDNRTINHKQSNITTTNSRTWTEKMWANPAAGDVRFRWGRSLSLSGRERHGVKRRALGTSKTKPGFLPLETVLACSNCGSHTAVDEVAICD